MPHTLVSISITRKTETGKTGTGYTSADVAVTGSPFRGYYFRTAQVVPIYDVAQGGRTTVDDVLRLSFHRSDNPGGFPPVELGDIATVPDGSKLLITRVRPYVRTLQCDCTGGVTT